MQTKLNMTETEEERERGGDYDLTKMASSTNRVDVTLSRNWLHSLLEYEVLKKLCDFIF